MTDSGGGESVADGVDIWTNSGTPARHIAFTDNASDTDPGAWEGTGSGTSQAGQSYYNVHLRVKLNNSNITGFDDRYGFLRVWGGAISPLYVNTVSEAKIPLKTGIGGTPGTDWDTYYIPMTLPGLGTDREFRVQVLDENFTVIADSGIETMTIEQSDKVAPGDYEQEREI